VKCLDTDLLIAILRGKPEAASKVKELDEEAEGATTAVNVFEIFFGAHKSANKVVNLKETLRLVERLEVTPLDLGASRKAAEIAAKLSAKGEAMDYRDAMIAGIVVENDLTLVTRNAAHFARVKGLKFETW
jgi:predicted nucleic acid-binding protein